MDKIDKALRKLTPKECEWIKTILLALNSNNMNSLDIKKLKERADIFRARKGKIRILYLLNSSGSIYILKISRRNDRT